MEQTSELPSSINYENFDISKENKKEITFLESAKNMAITGPLNILLLAVPIAIISYAAEFSDPVTFVFSLLALAPLAERLGYVTEQLSLHTNETIGGLLNATFGNATELIVAITALSRGLYRLVQLSLLGSILSNLLLVLGTAFFCGGLYNKTQTYGTISSQINSTLLMLSTMGILFPTVLSASGQETTLGQLGLSRATSLILFILYLAYLFFQLFSHRHLYENENNNENENKSKYLSQDIEGSIVNVIHSNRENEDNNIQIQPKAVLNQQVDKREDNEEDEEEEDELGFTNALIWLAGMTVLIAILSDAISESIQSAADSANISAVFISAIVLPIVGNAAEHAGAVMFAVKGKVDLSLGVAIGSSTQIALCVLPLLVILGWMMNKDLDLDFGQYESSTLFMTVVSVTFALKDGTSNWLVGITLIAAYLIISVGFWAHYNESLDS